MSTMILLISLSFLIFIGYITFINLKYGVQTSLSASYYCLPSKWGWLFTLFMWAIAFLLLPAWIEVCNTFVDWRIHFMFLSFFTCALICFVGAAPNFRGIELESKVHTIAATASAVTAILWCVLCCYHIVYITLIAAAIPVIVGAITKTLKKCLVYWIEMSAFLAVYITLLFYIILL